MPIACVFGSHDWNGCKCSKCGKVRDEGHVWSTDCENCATCGKTRPNTHKWNGCKCTSCSKTRDNGHDWSKNCEKCSICGKTRDKGHDWSKDCEKCATCGNTSENAHTWTGCKCTACGESRDKGHDWSKDCEKCDRCDATRQNAHRWNGCTCGICGRIRDEEHDFNKKSRKCSRCGKTPRLSLDELLEMQLQELDHICSSNPQWLNNIVGVSPKEFLFYVISRSTPEQFDVFLKYGAPVNALSSRGSPVLHLTAAFEPKPEHARLLLRYGADVNALDEVRETPLFAAAYHDYVDVAKVLLEGGAKTSVPGSNGNVFKYARGKVLELLKTHCLGVKSIILSGISVERWVSDGSEQISLMLVDSNGVSTPVLQAIRLKNEDDLNLNIPINLTSSVSILRTKCVFRFSNCTKELISDIEINSVDDRWKSETESYANLFVNGDLGSIRLKYFFQPAMD